MTFLLWFDDKDTVRERAIRAAAAYLAKRGRWPAGIQAHPADLPEPLTIRLDDKGQTVRVSPAPHVLRSHLHLVDEA